MMNYSHSSESSPENKKTGLSRIIEVFVVLLIMLFLFLTLYPAVQHVREQEQARANSRRNLRSLVLPLSNYAEDFREKVKSQEDQIQTPPQSWITAMLPYLDEAAMAAEIDDSQSWDAPANKQVFSIVLPAFLNPYMPEGPQQNSEGYALTHYSANSHLFPFTKSRNLATVKFADGLSNTIVIGEINSSLPAWGDPGNLRDPVRGLDGCSDCYGSPDREGAFMLFGDGSVRCLDKATDPRILEALSTPAGGEVFPLQPSK